MIISINVLPWESIQIQLCCNFSIACSSYVHIREYKILILFLGWLDHSTMIGLCSVEMSKINVAWKYPTKSIFKMCTYKIVVLLAFLLYITFKTQSQSCSESLLEARSSNLPGFFRDFYQLFRMVWFVTNILYKNYSASHRLFFSSKSCS